MGRVKWLWECWHECNRVWFNGKLPVPEAIRVTKAQSYEGKLHIVISEKDEILKNKIYISVYTLDPLGTLLHEMIHQYQAFVMKVEPDHGWSFRCYAKYLERSTGEKIR